MSDDEKEIRRVFDDIVRKGAYTSGHIAWVINYTNSKRVALQSELKELLDINECIHE